ncbi:MAG: hypothetical protein ACRD6U_06675 [Nitrososphaeraceae archaeon]
MNILGNPPKNKDFLKQIFLEISVLDTYTNKLYERSQYCQCNKFAQIGIEWRITDILQKMIDYCNNIITSFQLELKIKEVNEDAY